jgi:hypothetical protein
MARISLSDMLRTNYHIDLGIAFKEGCSSEHNEHIDYRSVYFPLLDCDIFFQFWCH